IVRRRFGRPDEDARAIPREEIEGLMPVVDRPDEGAVEPVHPRLALRRHCGRARDEAGDAVLLAEMGQSRAGHQRLGMRRSIAAKPCAPSLRTRCAWRGPTPPSAMTGTDDLWAMAA